MFKVYKYMLFKYLKSPSTWVILVLSMFIAGFLGGYLPFVFLKVEKSNVAISYGLIETALIAGLTTLLGIFVTIFSGFKAANMFKDEVEDGTFLVMLSKPISRAKIIFGKWWALMTFIVVYTLITILSFIIMIHIFDKGPLIKSELNQYKIQTLTSQIWVIGSIMWGILLLLSLIFSSISILISTKASVGATIGMTISLGIIIPITGLVSTFTQKQELTSSSKTSVDTMNSYFNFLKRTSLKNVPDSVKNAITEYATKFQGQLTSFTSNQKSLYEIGFKNGETDGFKNIWFFDLNYQLQRISSVATDRVLSSFGKDILTSRTLGSNGGVYSRVAEDKSKEISSKNNYKDLEAEMIKMISYSFVTIREMGTEIAPLIAQIANYSKDNPSILSNLKLAKEMESDPMKFLIKSGSQSDESKSSTDQNKAFLVKAEAAIVKALKDANIANETISSSDEATLKYLIEYSYQIDKNGNFKRNISKIKYEEYANKYNLIYTYLAIALILLPLTYALISRQDYR